MGQLRRMLIENQQSDLLFVEYLESTGTQWINTGFTSTNNLKLDFKYRLNVEPPNTVFALFGSRKNQSEDMFCSFVYASALSLSLGIRSSSQISTSSVGVDCAVHIENGLQTANSSTTHYTYTEMDEFYPLYFFTLNEADKGCDARIVQGRFYYFRIYDNDILVRNFVPAIYKGVPCMWETVEEKPYYNQGTGEFLTGDVIDLRFYEYLESNGTQYIDTGVTPNDTDAIDLKFIVPTFNNASSINCVLGARMGYNMPLLRFVVNKDKYTLQCDYGNSYNIRELQINSLGTLFELSFSRTEIVVNKNSLSITEDDYDECTKTMYMFTLHGEESGGAQSFSNSRIYHCKMKKDGILVRDFIPCSYNGAFGMLDLVEFKFYGNSGTGAFTVGKEIRKPSYAAAPFKDSNGFRLLAPSWMNDGDEMEWKQMIDKDKFNVRGSATSSQDGEYLKITLTKDADSNFTGYISSSYTIFVDSGVPLLISAKTISDRDCNFYFDGNGAYESKLFSISAAEENMLNAVVKGLGAEKYVSFYPKEKDAGFLSGESYEIKDIMLVNLSMLNSDSITTPLEFAQAFYGDNATEDNIGYFAPSKNGTLVAWNGNLYYKRQ